jgi:hypothetical protein
MAMTSFLDIFFLHEKANKWKRTVSFQISPRILRSIPQLGRHSGLERAGQPSAVSVAWKNFQRQELADRSDWKSVSVCGDGRGELWISLPRTRSSRKNQEKTSETSSKQGYTENKRVDKT